MSMPKALMRNGRGNRYRVADEQVVKGSEHHNFKDHNFHGSHCPVLTSPEGKCLVLTNPELKTCCDPCVFHGPNCTVGICLGCWLYGKKRTIHHFMPDLPRKRHFKRKDEKGKP